MLTAGAAPISMRPPVPRTRSRTAAVPCSRLSTRALRVRQQGASRRGQPHAARQAHEQLGAELGLEPLQARRQPRLRHVQLARGRGEVAAARDGEEALESGDTRHSRSAIARITNDDFTYASSWRTVVVMALVTPSFRSLADATRRAGRAHVATAAPVKHRPDAPAAPVGEGTRREHVRMQLLVARARAARD